MIIIFSTLFYFILENKFSTLVAKIGTVSLLVVNSILIYSLTNQNYGLYLLALFSFITTFSYPLNLKIQLKRRLYILPLFFFSLLGLCYSLFGNSISIKIKISTLLVGLLLGFLLDFLTNLPYGFQSFKEYFYFKEYLKSNRTNVKLLIKCLELNITNFTCLKELLDLITRAPDSSKNANFNQILINCLFFWSQNENYKMLSPLVLKFNELSFDQLKKDFVIYDLADNDVDLILNIFRSGCWKPGLFILDQFLVANKFSTKYTSTLIFADKYLNDLKKASFDNESIEYWLKTYSECFKGTPISQKINLVYHNKEDWFNRDVQHIAL